VAGGTKAPDNPAWHGALIAPYIGNLPLAARRSFPPGWFAADMRPVWMWTLARKKIDEASQEKNETSR
jgi:hypothetical protein